MKYLGVIISEDDKNLEHILKQKKAAFRALARLKVLGIISGIVQPNMKGHLYNTYIRPVLFYGLENFNLNLSERLTIKRIEGNIVKNIIGIPRRCKSTELFLALNIEPTYARLNKLKCDSFERLNFNNYTKCVLNYLETVEVKDSIISEIDKIGCLIEDQYSNSQQVERVELCKIYKYIAKADFKSQISDSRIAKIRNIFKSNSQETISKLLFEELKFGKQN